MRFVGLTCLALAGCTVNVASFQPGGDDTDGGVTAALDPGPSPLRRLTTVEYNNTVADLLGDTTAPANAFPASVDSVNQTFSNNVELQSADEEMMSSYLDAAQTLAQNATAHLATLLPTTCNVAAVDSTCVAAFIQRFGQRAYRRPVTDDEATMLLGVYTAATAQFDSTTGLQLVMQVVLSDPSFLYRPEFGVTGGSGSNVALTSWEMASRLSYFLWSTMPDDTLFELASNDQLTTADQVTAQARAMLADPRAHVTMQQFHDEWLELTSLYSAAQKDPKAFPTFGGAQLMLQQETEAFFENVIWDGPGDLPTLLTAPYSYMNATVASFYGVSGAQGSAFTKVALDPNSRAGFLTQASILAENAHLDTTSPTLRGKFVLGQLLCSVPGSPPNNTPPAFPTPTPGETIREQVMAHATDPSCSGCHDQMDPIGLGFEQYNAVGLYNAASDSGSGALNMSDEAGGFIGGVELAQKLADSTDVAHCMTTQWFRWASGRLETADDGPNIDALASDFEANGEKIQDLLVGITSSELFRFRRAAGSN